MIERASKFAAAASTLLIVVLLLSFHPDITLGLQVIGAAAFLFAAFASDQRIARHARGLVGAVGRGWPFGARAISRELENVSRGTGRDRALEACLLAAPLAPALLWLVAGREQPVVDVVWMAALAGALVRAVSWSEWSLPPLWRPLAAGWALALALAWPVLAARELNFDPAGLRDWGAVVSWAFWPAPFAVSWLLYWVLTHLLALLWLDWLSARFTERPGRLPAAAHALWIGTTIASVVAVVQGSIDLTFLNPPFWSSRLRATGMMLEANGFGHAAAIAGPIAFLALRTSHPVWAWAALVVNWSGLWMSGSRTALMCAAIGGVGLLAGSWRGTSPSRRHALATIGVLVPAAIAVALAAGATGPLRRVAEIPLDGAGVADFWERGGYGSIAVQMVREYPLTGTGTGTYHYLAPDYYRAIADDALAPDNAQNWWRHQAAELGVLGGALLLLWSLVLAAHAVAGRARMPGAAPPTVRALLVGVALSSMLGVPTQNPTVLIWFFLLVGWMPVLIEAPRPLGTMPVGQARSLWILAGVLAVSYAGGHMVLARTSLAVPARASRFEREYVAGAYQPETRADETVFRWTDDESRFVLPARTPWLVVTLWAGHPDVSTSPVEVSLSTPCGLLWSEVLSTPDPVTVGVELPKGLESVDATVTVGRTWRPSTYGSPDERDLGVGVSMAFAGSLEGAEEQTHVLRWPPCPRPGD